MSEKAKNPNFIITYLVPLFLYFFTMFKIYMSAISDNGDHIGDAISKIALLQIAFLVGLFLLMYSLNIRVMSQTCSIGTKNFALNAFLYTFVPFIFIMGTLVTVLVLMPGWKAPFSNTIGFFLVKNIWARKLFKTSYEWIRIKSDRGENEPASLIHKLNTVNNRTFFLNELTPDNFFNAIKSLNIGDGATQFNFIQPKDGEVSLKKQLYSAVVLKDMISEFLWYFLGGILTFSVSQIYIIDNVCGELVDKEEGEDEGEEEDKDEGEDEGEGESWF